MSATASRPAAVPAPRPNAAAISATGNTYSIE